MTSAARARPFRAMCLLEDDGGGVQLLGDETVTTTPDEALRYFIPLIAHAAAKAFHPDAMEGTIKPGLGAPDCTEGIAHVEHAVLDEDKGEFLVVSERFGETLERYRGQRETAQRAAESDDFYQRMLVLALRKANPDLDEVKALLRLIQEDGGDPEQVYQESLSQLPQGANTPDYQSVAPSQP